MNGVLRMGLERYVFYYFYYSWEYNSIQSYFLFSVVV